MAKGTGLIGNFKGKVGNTVGYKLSASNNGQTQGIRVYQPIVKNPKTAAQAEQRAKLSPINATYRALKMVIDRGNESLPYGNKSRLAWLKKAFNAQTMPWFKKGEAVVVPVCSEISRGSLASIYKPSTADNNIVLTIAGISEASTTTIGALSTAILAAYPTLRDGDQLTFVEVEQLNGSMMAHVQSLVIDTTSTAAIPSGFQVGTGELGSNQVLGDSAAGALIISREGTNGEHLRSTENLNKMGGYESTFTDPTTKQEAIESYMAAASGSTDWAEESIQ
ncbi:MAG: hypothetical protein J6R36_03430 [Bacteroidaceae bacterium]|nr:hypothetical protein [Bacteroidaceae bacterium]